MHEGWVGVWVGTLVAVALLSGCEQVDRSMREKLGLPERDYKPPAPKVEGPRIDATPVLETPAFVGAEGTDAFGHPRKLPDRVALLNLLHLRRFDALERLMAHFQEEFERDYRKEQWPDRALSAFFVSDPKVTALLDEWVQRSSGHFAPWLARGNHRLRMAGHYRGTKWAYQTSPAQFASMEDYHRAAKSDLQRALELAPKLVAAYARLLMISHHGSTAADQRALVDKATAVCPLCGGVRAVYMEGLTPRWGGSHAQMQAFVEELRPLVAQEPRLRMLSASVPADRCRSYEDHEREKALADCNAALAAGDDPSVLVDTSWHYDPKREPQRILELLDRALALDPQDRDALERRYAVRIEVKDYLGAAEDMITSRHLEPTDSGVAANMPWLVDMLRYEGDQRYKAGKTAEALPYFRLGLQLAPDDHDLRRRSGWAQRGATETAVSDQLAQRDDDFELRLERDHALASQGKFAEVVQMWDEFIVRHGNDPRPFQERAGAKWHLGQRDAARGDMQQACSLGLQKACEDFAKMSQIR